LIALVNPLWAYTPNMESHRRADVLFGKRVREERDRRGWSQEELAKRLTDKGITVYPSTIAKIESERKPRPARLAEAIGVADLFGMTLDNLLGRPDDSTLTFALATLCSYAGDAQGHIHRALEVSTDIDDQIESVKATFDLPGIEDLRQVAKNLDGALAAAQSTARKLVALVSGAIVLLSSADR
jgi:transcriptional regulator with XRE-family HTH domain